MSQLPDFKSLILWTKFTLLHPKILSSYLALKRNERLSPDALAALNWQKRQRLLRFAYENVPYYRAKYDAAGLNPLDIRTPEQWESVPVLEKPELVKHLEDLKTRGVKPDRLRLSTTGGSTGVPVIVYFDKKFAMEPIRWRMLSWWGVGPGEDAAFAWRDFGWPALEKLRRSVLFWPTRRIYLDASLVTKASLDAFVRQYQAVRPSLLQGYVGAIESLADFVIESGVSFPPPKAVWLTAAPVSKTQRARMQAAFHAPVYDQYGCGEIYQIAAQCAHSENLHIFYDSVCVEFLDGNGRSVQTGERGLIALTDLDNYVFPLIRYLNGDEGSAVAGQCACGVNLPLMGPIKGRDTDHLHLPQGGIIVGDFVTTIFDNDPDCIKAFQVYQKKDLGIDVRVVLNPAVPDARERVERVVAKMREKSLGLVEVRPVYMDEIVSDRGKTRYIVREK